MSGNCPEKNERWIGLCACVNDVRKLSERKNGWDSPPPPPPPPLISFFGSCASDFILSQAWRARKNHARPPPPPKFVCFRRQWLNPLNVWLKKVLTEVCFSLVTHWFHTCHSKMIIKWHSLSKFHGWMTCWDECHSWNLEWTRTLLCYRLSVLQQVKVQACVVR